MIVAFCSDLHLEFGGRDFDLPDADVLLLAGDICVIHHLSAEYTFDLQGQQTAQFFMDVAAKYKRVIWIPGNHEFYDGVIGATSTEIVTEFFLRYFITNIEYRTCGNVLIDDVKFVFATLWTDFNRGNPLVMNSAQYDMNDYRKIMIGDFGLFSGVRYISTTDIKEIHDTHRNYIGNNVKGHDKVVVMTHHTPNMRSVGAVFRSSTLNYAYCCTDMDDIMLDNEQIKCWIHGHVHNNSDYMIGNTNVLSNCRGYSGHEASANVFKIQTFNI